MSGILLLVEATGDQLAATTGELVAEGNRLAQQLGNGPVTVLLAGKGVGGLADGLGQLGVEHVLAADYPGEGLVSPDWLLTAAEQAASQLQPDVVLLTHSAGSRALAASLAYRLETGIVTDATALRAEGDELVITKPVYGGSAIAEFAIATSPRVITLRPRAFEAAEAPTATQANVETLSASAADGAIEVLEEIREQASSGPRLKDAKVIISGGRGLGGPENWHYVEELAQVLGAAIGATRAVTDAGWVAPSLQVGLTGATVAPDLYITIGISGAVQHIAGISGARNVVAINRDADANIFKYARYGVVGDWKQIVPGFTQRLKELRG
jgi:electron transfer flavoprotein alpha subunit